jgi:hypothetical protein
LVKGFDERDGLSEKVPLSRSVTAISLHHSTTKQARTFISDLNLLEN